MSAAESVVVLTTLKHLGEGYRIITPEGVYPAIVETVDWEDEEGERAIADLSDDSELSGPGDMAIAAVWHEDADKVTAAEIAAAPAIKWTRS